MKKHLIFMDIDGTLVDSDLKISEKNKSIINHVLTMGHIVYVATGRKHYAAKEIAQLLNPAVQVVASNGCIYEYKNRLFCQKINPQAAAQLIDLTYNSQAALFFFGERKTFYTNQLPEYFKKEDQARLSSGQDSQLFGIHSKTELIKIADELVNAIVIAENDYSILEPLKEQLATIEQLTLSSSHENNIEVTPSGISKASAIQDLQKRYQIPKERTISFGDGKNDLEMFAASGISVAMANASEEVKKQATHQTLTNKQSGIGYFLSTYFNLKENNYEGTDHVELHQPRTTYFA